MEEVNSDLVLLAALNLASKVEELPLCLRAMLREFELLQASYTGGNAINPPKLS